MQRIYSLARILQDLFVPGMAFKFKTFHTQNWDQTINSSISVGNVEI